MSTQIALKTEVDIVDNTPAHEVIPLQNQWSFWYDKFQGPGLSADQYAAAQKRLMACGTVQKFWLCFNALPAATSLGHKSSYHLMRGGIRPVWEDPDNETGGIWFLRLALTDADAAWRELALAVIGEQFASALKPGDAINGLTCSVRKDYALVQIWNKQAHPEAEEGNIMKKAREILGSMNTSTYYYKPCKQHDSYEEKFKDRLKSSGDKHH